MASEKTERTHHGRTRIRDFFLGWVLWTLVRESRGTLCNQLLRTATVKVSVSFT